MKNLLPTHRKSRRSTSINSSKDASTKHISRQTIMDTIAKKKGKRNLAKDYYSMAIFLLAVIVSISLFRTDYSLESMLESAKEIANSGENQTSTIVTILPTALPTMKQTPIPTSIPTSIPTLIPTPMPTKFDWDKIPPQEPIEYDGYKTLFYKSQSNRNPTFLFNGMSFGELRYSGNLKKKKISPDDDAPILLYNPLQEDRFWCGELIPGGDFLLKNFTDECRDENNSFSPPYVYSKGPPAVLNEGIHDNHHSAVAIELLEEDFASRFKSKISTKSEFEPVRCSVPCKRKKDYDYLKKIIRIANTNWTFWMTMEGEQYYPLFKVDPTNYRRNIFYSTTSFKSEIPLPYFSLNSFLDVHPAVDFDGAIKGASFIARNCKSRNHREEVVTTLIEAGFRVDSLSRCLKNAEPPPGSNIQNKTSMQEQYLFHLAFENQNTNDYITEKLWDTFKSGTLPVYLGGMNIKENVPKNSIVVARDFENPQALADYLIRLSNDKELYESYHKWRYEPIEDWFVEKYEFSNTHNLCRTCKWVYAKRHGLGWNHAKQAILKPQIHHKTCRNANGLLDYPFQEHWFSFSRDADETKGPMGSTQISSSEEGKTCELNNKNRVIEVDNGAIRRKVYDHDGVTDIFIDFTANEGQKRKHVDYYVLRLETTIKPGETNPMPHVVNDSAWWIQDDQSRLYVMVSGDGDIKLSVDKPGTIDIAIQFPYISNNTDNSSTGFPAASARVRVATEDIDNFHKDAYKFTTYFGDLMIRDFFQPLESYQIP